MKIIKLLVEHGADINRQTKNDLTSLMWATGYQKTEPVKILLQLGADKSLRDNRGLTALMIAKENNFKEIIKLLEQ